MTPDDPTFDPRGPLDGGQLESDPDAPPSAEEARAAEDLRVALSDSSKAHEGAELARALHLAHDPRPLGRDAHEALVDRALAAPKKSKRSGVVVRVAFGVAAAVSLAAGIAFLVGRSGLDPAQPETTAVATAKLPLVHVRSTQPLFAEPFAAKGGTSARIDRIAMAREGDLRDNRFARWGVR
jgi:hypothetical protein